jgi:hypothetical protein
MFKMWKLKRAVRYAELKMRMRSLEEKVKDWRFLEGTIPSPDLRELQSRIEDLEGLFVKWGIILGLTTPREFKAQRDLNWGSIENPQWGETVEPVMGGTLPNLETGVKDLMKRVKEIEIKVSSKGEMKAVYTANGKTYEITGIGATSRELSVEEIKKLEEEHRATNEELRKANISERDIKLIRDIEANQKGG